MMKKERHLVTVIEFSLKLSELYNKMLHDFGLIDSMPFKDG